MDLDSQPACSRSFPQASGRPTPRPGADPHLGGQPGRRHRHSDRPAPAGRSKAQPRPARAWPGAQRATTPMDRRRASHGAPPARPRLSLGRSNGATRYLFLALHWPAGEPGGHRAHGAVWVRSAYGAIARVDTRTREVQNIPVGNSPSAVATGAGGVWVTDDVDNTVARIDPASANAVTRSTPVGRGRGRSRQVPERVGRQHAGRHGRSRRSGGTA